MKLSTDIKITRKCNLAKQKQKRNSKHYNLILVQENRSNDALEKRKKNHFGNSAKHDML